VIGEPDEDPTGEFIRSRSARVTLGTAVKLGDEHGSTADAELVSRWHAGDQHARDALMERHYGRIRRFFDVKVPGAAADLAQQTFVACIESKDKLEKRESFRAFLFGIARNLLLRHLRAAAQDASRIQAYETTPGDAPTPSAVVAREQEQWLVLRAMEALPTDLRIALELHYWEAMTSSEIATVLRVPVSTITTRLSRARTRLFDRVAQLSEPGRALGIEEIEAWTRSLVEA
jgi:RNA polymerase sigma-70 factor (ECF subfamily)